MQRTQHPADDEFPYYLEVNDHHDSSDGITWFPRYGWACLWRHNPDGPVSDANPYPAVYVQEQSFTYDDYVNNDGEDTWEFPIASPGVMYPHQIQDTDGWDTGPSRLWDFIETVRDKYYEHGLVTMPDEQVQLGDMESQAELSDSTRETQLGEELPVRVFTHRMEDTYDDSSFDEVCEIYFRNGANDVEYLMWNSNELYGPDGEPNSELIQKVLVAVASAYETPDDFIEKWSHSQVKITESK